VDFEWDPNKEKANLQKHGISFVAAAQVLRSGTAMVWPTDHEGESRWLAVGKHPAAGRVVAIIYTVREGRYRIISARRARRNEEEAYKQRIGTAPARAEGQS
jgi:uncharacterized DUF497 family protein